MPVRRLSAAVLTALAGLLLTLLSAAPAQALDLRGWTHSAGGTMYDGCFNQAYSYSIRADADVDSWDVDLTLWAPDGSESSSDWVWGSGAGTGSGTFFICGYEGAGRYTISAEVTFYDYDYNSYTVSLPDSSFVMRRVPTATRLTVGDGTPYFNQRVRLGVLTRVATRRGSAPNEYAQVVVQARVKGEWRRVQGSRTSVDDRGRVSYRYRWNVRRPLLLRAVTLAEGNHAGSVSRVVRVDKPRRTRGHHHQPPWSDRAVAPVGILG